MKPVQNKTVSLDYQWLTQVYEIIKDWIYIVTANGLSFVKNMFTKEEVIIHLPWIFRRDKAVGHSFSHDKK